MTVFELVEFFFSMSTAERTRKKYFQKETRKILSDSNDSKLLKTDALGSF